MSEGRRLNRRARGWLKFLYYKATTPDDWSSSGRPAPWWDDLSTPPVLNFPRFDLSESSYAIPMMADVTPAWREVYVDIMDGLLQRHTTHWAAVDWLTQIGHDPDRANYPQDIIDLWIPSHLVGEYDRPGWVANGVAPWGLAPDPVSAPGNLFYKGFFNLMLGIYGYVSKDRRWNQPFAVTGCNDTTYSWTHDGINALLTRQWAERPEGPHCENTKIWPYCLSAAGLGLQMHDVLSGGHDHWVYDRWVEIFRDKFAEISPGGQVTWTSLYYDPLVDYHHRAGPTSGLSVAFYMQPQVPSLAEALYRSAADRIGWSDPSRPIRSLPDPRLLLLGALLAREFGDDITHARLLEHTETHCEPYYFGASGDDFGFGFGLGEAYPRGQLSALLMMGEIGLPGAWSRVFNQPNLTKFDEPTVSGVDFPRLGIDMAYNDAATAVLHVGTYAATASMRGASTTVRMSQLRDTATCAVRMDGVHYECWRAIDRHTIDIDLSIDDHEIQVFPTPPTTATPAVGMEREYDAFAQHERRESGPHGLAGPRRAPDQGAAPDGASSGADVPVLGLPRPPCSCC
jgi:hypothetical protein